MRSFHFYCSAYFTGNNLFLQTVHAKIHYSYLPNGRYSHSQITWMHHLCKWIAALGNTNLLFENRSIHCQTGSSFLIIPSAAILANLFRKSGACHRELHHIRHVHTLWQCRELFDRLSHSLWWCWLKEVVLTCYYRHPHSRNISTIQSTRCVDIALLLFTNNIIITSTYSKYTLFSGIQLPEKSNWTDANASVQL